MDLLPHFCESNNPSSSEDFHTSVWDFLNALNLPKIHPHCLQDSLSSNITDFFLSSGALPLQRHEYERLSESFYTENFGSRLLTAWYQNAPALLAMTELWFRLVSFSLAPISICLLMMNLRRSPKDIHTRSDLKHLGLAIMSTTSSAILLVDSLYVFTYGRWYGLFLFVISMCLSIQGLVRMRFYRRWTTTHLSLIVCLTLYLIIHSQPIRQNHFDHPGIDIPTIKEGLYYSTTNPFISSIVQHWPEKSRTYNVFTGATFYLPTGDSLTGIPFLVNQSPNLSYERRWVLNTHDLEAVAIDIAFPSDGIHNPMKPIYVLLHGLNGGSHEEYVRDFVARSTQEGSTCVVMIARGLMDTPVRGWNVFHGARTTDIEAVAQAVRKAVGSDQMLVGVGFSMGAIVLSNYVAKSGSNCQFDAAMAVSGGLDMRENLNFRRSMRLWQPLLAQGLRQEFIVKKFNHLFQQRLNKEQHLHLMRASSITVSLYSSHRASLV